MTNTPPPAPAVVILGPSGLATGHRAVAALPGARLHAPARLSEPSAIGFESAPDHIRALFSSATPIVSLCAAGILIRILAPLIDDKRRDPAVVAVAEDGSSAVPLLGGHRGANEMARTLAADLGGHAAITTAGDLRLGLSLEEPPPGWRIADPAAVKPVTAALLAGQAVGLRIEAAEAWWLTAAGLAFQEGASPAIRITDRRVAADPQILTYHPPVLAVGVGCERDAPPEALIALAEATLSEGGLSPDSVACVTSIDLKMDEPAVHALVDHWGVSARFFSASALEAETPRLANPSAAVFAAVGCHGVAEASAIAAVGFGGELIAEKRVGARVTCALARAPRGLNPDRVGRARGRLAVVGIGPGSAAWRSPEASGVLARARHVVGYGPYLDLIGDTMVGKQRHDRPLTAEEDRARLALDLAGEGESVAIVSSGDAGIYAMASLLFELLDREDRPAWNRVAVDVVPGISALQAAAARLGAPLGHDFCAVSLSDLLTPWPVIAARLEAAAAADFVVALYNPVSARRDWQLGAARDILLQHRPPQTPVALARNLGRAGESVRLVDLAGLEPAMADMLTTVLIGSRATRRITRGQRTWLYTPRGYRVAGHGS